MPDSDFSGYRSCFRVSLHLSPLYLKGFVVSPYLPSLVSLSLSLLVSQPLWTASGVRLSRCLSSLKWLDLFPAMTGGLSILGGVVWLSECFSLRVFLMCPLFWLVVPLSECLLFALTWLPSFFLTICLPIHLSPNSCVFISLPYSGDV